MPEISLVNGSIVIPGTVSGFTATTKCTGTFALAGTAPGIYNLTVITNPGGPNGTKAFTVITVGSGTDPAIYEVSPRFLRTEHRSPCRCHDQRGELQGKAGITVTITNRTTNNTTVDRNS